MNQNNSGDDQGPPPYQDQFQQQAYPRQYAQQSGIQQPYPQQLPNQMQQPYSQPYMQPGPSSGAQTYQPTTFNSAGKAAAPIGFAAEKLFPQDGPTALQKISPQIMGQLDQLAQIWGISRLFRERMPNLYGKEFVFLFDDSGSMRNTDRGATMSRWNELKHFAANAIALASAFDADGVDVYFLNRPKVSNVKSIAQLEQVFLKEPTDYCLTPLTNKLELILQEHRQQFAKGNMILIIATDGEPKARDGSDSVRVFTDALRKRHHTVGVPSVSYIPISIRACTNDDNSIGYLNKLDNDKKMYLDVCDDYHAELIEIQNVLGRDFTFTFGDFTLKTLLGSVDAWMDNTDEPQNFTKYEVNYQKFGEIPDSYVAPKKKKGLFGSLFGK